MPRKTKQTKPTARRKRAVKSDPTAVREIVTRGIALPVGMVMLSADRIQEVLDDAAERGRITRDDAQVLTQDLIHKGRNQTEDLMREIERLLGKGVDQIGSAAQSTARAASEAATRLPPRPGSKEPVAGYDGLTAAQAIELLDQLSQSDLRALESYERRNANRKTVLRAVEQRLSAAS